MDLITAKCPDCGADLKIAPGALNVVCDYCGTNILVTDVLGSGAVVQNCMTLAYAAMQGENYQDAFDQFNKALEHGSNNYNAWFGKATCAGMLSRMSDVRFDEMIVLFENAFNNAPADKVGVLRRSAAAEIVKAVRNSVAKIHMADELMIQVTQAGMQSSELGGFSGGNQQMKNEAFRALAKAREYDPANNDVIKLQSELGDTIKITSSEPLVIPQQYPTLQDAQQMKPQVPGKKKSGGCAIIAAAVGVLILGLVVGIILFSSGGKDKSDNTPPKQLPSSYTYSIVKLVAADGKFYIIVYTDASVDNDFIKINNEVIQKYTDKTGAIVINYYTNRSQAEKNAAVQAVQNDEWVMKNANSMFLKAVCEYNTRTSEKKFYKIYLGKKVDLEVNVEPPVVPNK